MLPGRGFSELVPGGLPLEAHNVFVDLAIVDWLMAEYRTRRFNEADTGNLINARDAIQHRLLSIPSWYELEQTEKDGRYSAVYECCRITAVLYSHCVMFPLPAQSDGIQKPLKELRRILEITKLNNWTEEVFPMLTWCLLVCGIAAYRTHHKQFFVRSLSAVLTRSRVLSLHVAQRIAQQFIWSHCACERGAVVLWDELGIELPDFS